MTQRLPTPGQDDGTWGDVLNGFLEVSHASDGTLASGVVGTNQLQTGSVTNAQLDTPTQAALGKASSSIQTVNTRTPDGSGAVSLSATDINAVELAGDLGGTNGAPEVQSIQGVSISGSPTTGQIMTATSPTAATWATVASGAQGPAGPSGMNWRGIYSNATTYGVNDAVSYNGSAYLTAAGVTGVNPGTPASPTSPWSLVASIGNTGPASSGAAGIISPASVGFLAWTYDIATQQGTIAVGSPYQGQLFGSLISLNAGTVSSITYRVWTAGTNLTSGQNFVALYTAAGSLIATTADQTTSFELVALHSAALTSPATITTGLYYVAFLSNMPTSGATLPAFITSYRGDTPTMNAGTTMRCGQLGNGFNLTTPPANFTPGTSSANNINFWATLS